MSQNATKSTRLPSRGMIILMIVVTLIAGGGLIWWFTSGSESLEPKSTNSADYVHPEGKPPVELQSGESFVEHTIYAPVASGRVPVQSTCVADAPSVNFDTELTDYGNVVQKGELTFLRDSTRALVDVPAGLSVTMLYVDGQEVGLPIERGWHKTTFTFPQESWGQVTKVTVCVI